MPHYLRLTPNGFKELNTDLPKWFTEPVDFTASCPDEYAVSILPLAAQILNRMIPNAPVILVPKILLGSYDTNGIAECQTGICFGKDGIAMSLNENTNAWGFLSTCLHEAWHLVDFRMTVEERTIAYREVSDGIPLPDGYYDSPIERSARSFAAWALFQLSRNPHPLMPKLKGKRTAEHIYWEVLTGNYCKPKSISIFQLYISDFRWLASLPLNMICNNAKNRR